MPASLIAHIIAAALLTMGMLVGFCMFIYGAFTGVTESMLLIPSLVFGAWALRTIGRHIAHGLD